MPTYEYRCSKCEDNFEVVQKITDDPVAKCSKCGGGVERLINATNFILKGNGWYKTDYSSPEPAASSEAGSCSADMSKPACQACPAKSS